MTTYAEAVSILERCDHADRWSEVRMGRGRTLMVCTDCWNAQVAARRAARKEELAARPLDCQRCAAHPHNWNVAGYKLCGRCKTVALREHHIEQAKLGPLAFLVPTGPLFSTAGWKGLPQ